MNLLDMQKNSSVISLPLSEEVDLIKSPQYLVLKDKDSENGSLFILQNVMGGSRKRVINVIIAFCCLGKAIVC